jgi:O-antigen/teichoic acid export membrane protein
VSIKRNVVANFLGKIWAGAINFLVVPIYLKFLGIEAYGLIGFFASLLAVSLLLDLGLSTTLNRELARIATKSDYASESRNLMRSLEYVYWFVAVLIGILIFVSAHQLATSWLAPNSIGLVNTTNAIELMGVVIALRWPATLYLSGLMGLHRQVLANVISAAMVTLQACSAVAAMEIFGRNVRVFFIAQSFSALVQIVVFVIALWNSLPSSETRPQFLASSIRTIWHFAIGVSGITICSVILTQADKVLLSKLLSLESFGYYVLAGSIAGVLNLPAMAMYATFFPVFARVMSNQQGVGLAWLYHGSCQMLSMLVFPAGILLTVFSEQLLMLYTRNESIAFRSHSLLSLFALGNTFLSTMLLPLALQLASGWTKLSFYKNVVAIVIYIPLVVILVLKFGAIGATGAWLLLSLGYVGLEIPLMHRVLLRAEKRRWYLFDIGVPLLISVAVIGSARLLLPATTEVALTVAYMALSFAISFGGCLAVFMKWGNIRSRLITGEVPFSFPRELR